MPVAYDGSFIDNKYVPNSPEYQKPYNHCQGCPARTIPDPKELQIKVVSRIERPKS